MTKPKIANGNCLNPISRLDKRFEEYKRCHQAATKNCIKVQESHNKSNDALKALLERKSKLLDSKMKKKRSTATTSVNRKKPKLAHEQIQSGTAFFENRVETTPNVTLNVHSSEIPDIDWDSFDILNNPNFSMSINEQELDGVLNSCYSQTTQVTDLKTTLKTSELNQLNVCKTSPEVNNDSLFIQNNAPKFSNKETVFPPLFPPPENQSLPCQPQPTVKFEYLSPQNYLSSTACNYNPTTNIVQPSTNQIDSQTAVFNSQNSLYPMNLPAINGTNSLSYQYHNSLVPDPMVGNATQYFYQYPNYEDHHSANNTADSFQLPAMSTGWYNGVSDQATLKPTNCKQSLVPQQQQQQQQFVNTSIAIANYRNNYGQYHQITPHQDNSQIQYQQQMFASNHSQTYECPTQGTIANYAMLPEQQSHQQYYYMDYHSNNGNRAVVANTNTTANSFISANNNNNRSIDPRFISHQTNPVLCRNIYQ